MKVWDLRNDRDVPATTFMLSDQVKVNLISLFVVAPTYKLLIFLIKSQKILQIL